MKSLLLPEGHSKMSIASSMLWLLLTMMSLSLYAQEPALTSRNKNYVTTIRFNLGDINLSIENRKRITDLGIGFTTDDVAIDYITSTFYPEITGKVKTIGRTTFEYYVGDFYPEIKGNIKSIGNVNISYYVGDYYPEIKGKIKSIGNTSFEYYTGDFYPEIKGLIKSIGNASFEYYTGDFYSEIKGKLKAIKGNKGSSTFTISLN